MGFGFGDEQWPLGVRAAEGAGVEVNLISGCLGRGYS